MSVSESYDQLIQRVKEVQLLESISEVLGWDERTHMPPGGSPHRAEQMAFLAKLMHQKLTSAAIGELLGCLEGSGLQQPPDSDRAVNLREIRRVYDRAVKMPPALVEEIARTTTRAQLVWQEARQANDFAAFQPYLEKIVKLKREEAQAVGYREVPYDALLDKYEPGATTGQITQLFTRLRQELVPLVAAITSSGKTPNREILERDYPVEQQREFGQATAAALGFDFQAGRLDVTTHPFCSGLGPGDCRLTTRYNPRRFADGFFGILHETGHGLYEQGLDPAHFGTPCGMAASLGIHESQSRLWENQVGRSQPFWEHFFPKAQKIYPAALGNVKLDDFYFAINDVRKSFIRVEADEATYNLHILLRFELEQALISGDLQPADVPAAWEEKFHSFLDLTPPNFALGCLQDIHWSMGGLGYFPTYTLGNLYAAQLMEKIRTDLGDLDADVRRGEFGRLKGWLNANIHGQGQRYRAQDLCQRLTGQPLSTQPFMTYLRQKFGPLYDMKRL